MQQAIETIEQLNQYHQVFWSARKKSLDKLVRRSYVAELAAKRQEAKIQGLREVVDERVRLNRLRRMTSFESELENADLELAPRRLQLAQQARARRPRVRVTADGRTMRDIISAVALRPDLLREPAKGLWPVFKTELCLLNLAPTEESSRDHKVACHYIVDGQQRRITEGQFHNVVSKVRRLHKKKFSA
jgi:hypothetical protein